MSGYWSSGRRLELTPLHASVAAVFIGGLGWPARPRNVLPYVDIHDSVVSPMPQGNHCKLNEARQKGQLS